MKNTYVSDSPIHGKGLFAKNRIPKNKLIGEYLGIPTKRNGKYVLWIGDLALLVKNELKYANHSFKPNCKLIETVLYSTKNINKDDELTLHYGEDWRKEEKK